MRRFAICTALLLLAQAAQAQQKSLIPTHAVGVSYPLVVSVSVGGMLPLAEPKGSSYGFPQVPALRGEIEVGLGGGMISGGVSIPAGYGPAKINLKAAALRTWLWSFDRPVDVTSHGVIGELSVHSHPSALLGLGAFQEAGTDRGRFLFLYFGLGI